MPAKSVLSGGSRLGLLILGALLLSACGSGGGSNEADTVRLDQSSGNHFPISDIADVDLRPNAVPSSSTAGTPTGIRVFASDEDTSDNEVSYSLVDDAGGRFVIGSEDGVVRTAVTLFFSPVTRSYIIRALAESADGSESSASFEIEILPPDLFRVSEITDTDPAPMQILESAPAGAPVGVTVSANDRDIYDSEVRYRLLDDAGGLFVIDAVSGALSLRRAGILDARSSSEHTVIVLAESQDGSISTAAFTILVDSTLTVSVHFPASRSLVHPDASTLTLRGMARPAAYGPAVSSVTVSAGANEYPATLDTDNSWQVQIPIAGPVTLTVTVTDAGGHALHRLIRVEQEVAPPIALSDPLGLVLDEANQRILVADAGAAAIMAIDISEDCSYDPAVSDPPETGCLLSIISDADTGGGDDFMTLSGGIALDAPNNRALAVDSGHDAVMAVDLDSGDRSIFAQCSEFSGNTPNGIMIDAGRGRAVVSNSIGGSTDDQLLAIDLQTGDCTVLSSPSTGTGPSFSVPNKIAPGLGDTVLVADSGNPDTVFSVSLANGDRTVISGNAAAVGAGPVFQTPRAVVLDMFTDPANPRALVRDDSIRACGIIAVDMGSGDRSLFSISGSSSRCPDDPPVGAGPRITGAGGLILDTVSTTYRLLVADEDLSAIVSIDLNSGDRRQLHLRTAVPEIRIGAGTRLANPRALALDPEAGRLYAADSGHAAALTLDLEDRSRAILSSGLAGSLVGAGQAFVLPRGLALDPDNDRLLVVDSSTDFLYAVDLISGDRRVLSDNSVPSDRTFGSPRGSMALENAMTVLVADTARDTLFRVDLLTGVRTALATASNAELEGIQNVVLDRANSRALVSAASTADPDVLDGIIAVSLADGSLTRISTPDMGNGPVMTNPRGIALDAANNRLLTLDADLGALFAVDLETGDRTILAEGEYLQTAPSNSLALDVARSRIFVVQEDRPEVIMIDLATGSQVVIGN